MRLSFLTIYIARRVGISLIVLAGISMIAFWMSYLLPSDPVTSRYPDITAEQREEIRRQMGLDQPLVVQYARYMESVFRGDFGTSYNTGNRVIEDLKDRIPATLELAAFGIAFGLLLGLPMGIVAAVNRNRPLDHVMRVLSIGSQSLPAFWLGVVLIYFLYYQLRWVPAPVGRLSMGMLPPPQLTGFLIIDALLQGNWKLASASFQQILLPGVVLGLGLIAPIARITRAAMSEALQEDYITFARAIGLPERQVVLNDAFRGSLVAIATSIGFVIGNVLAGSAIVETVFAWPGLGRYAVTAITTSDMAPVTTCILLIASGVAITNLIVDLSYAWIDPRIRDGLASA
jgi:peptide/nickel transport system permease protein